MDDKADNKGTGKTAGLERTEELLTELEAATTRWSDKVDSKERLKTANDWFDSTNLDHLSGFLHALEHGYWPEVLVEQATAVGVDLHDGFDMLTKRLASMYVHQAAYTAPTMEEALAWTAKVHEEHRKWMRDPSAPIILPLYDDSTCSVEFVDITRLDDSGNPKPKQLVIHEHYRTAYLPRRDEHYTMDDGQYTVMNVAHRMHEGRHYYRMEVAKRHELEYAQSIFDAPDPVGEFRDAETGDLLQETYMDTPPEVGSRVRIDDVLYDVTMVIAHFPALDEQDIEADKTLAYRIGVQKTEQDEADLSIVRMYLDKAMLTDRLADMLTVVLGHSGITREQLEAVGTGDIEDDSLTARVKLDKRDCAVMCEAGVLTDEEEDS